MPRRSQPSLWIAETLTSPWAAERRNLFPSQKAGRDKTRAICCSSFVATDSTSSAHARIWTRFQRGAGRNFSASSATTISRSQIRWKNEVSSPAFGYGEASHPVAAVQRRWHLLVVDAGLMRKAAEENNGERTLTQTLELDRAVGVARSYGGPKSTIIVCGDVAIGGMSLNGFPFRKDSGIALLGFNSAGQPWITWATGPHGMKSYGAAKLPVNQDPAEIKEPTQEQPEPAAIYTKSALVTVEDVVAFGSGPGTDALQGVVESTDVFKILRDEL